MTYNLLLTLTFFKLGVWQLFIINMQGVHTSLCRCIANKLVQAIYQDHSHSQGYVAIALIVWRIWGY